MGPDSVGVASFSCSLRVRIYKVRGRTQIGEFLNKKKIGNLCENLRVLGSCHVNMMF